LSAASRVWRAVRAASAIANSGSASKSSQPVAPSDAVEQPSAHSLLRSALELEEKGRLAVARAALEVARERQQPGRLRTRYSVSQLDHGQLSTSSSPIATLHECAPFA
jgi:hypothetical protein